MLDSHSINEESPILNSVFWPLKMNSLPHWVVYWTCELLQMRASAKYLNCNLNIVKHSV